jgi:hypothetical protein
MKSKYVFIVYAKDRPTQYSGILGSIDLYKIQLLLLGGKYLLEESHDGPDPITWYRGILEQQDIYIHQGKQQVWKGQTIIWMEVDTEKTVISEFTAWNELEKTDTESLAWKTFLYPCQAGTTKECLGFAVSARELAMQQVSKPIMLHTVLDAILAS